MWESNLADMTVIIGVGFAYLPPVIMATKGANFTQSSVNKHRAFCVEQ
jgi:hypothetical protein